MHGQQNIKKNHETSFRLLERIVTFQGTDDRSDVGTQTDLGSERLCCSISANEQRCVLGYISIGGF